MDNSLPKTLSLMKTNSRALLLGAVVVLLFAAAYTSVGLEDASALKASGKKNHKHDSVKVHKGLMAHKLYQGR